MNVFVHGCGAGGGFRSPGGEGGFRGRGGGRGTPRGRGGRGGGGRGGFRGGKKVMVEPHRHEGEKAGKCALLEGYTGKANAVDNAHHFVKPLNK